jgi:hypothetical protein
MEQGDDDPSGLLATEIVSGKEIDQYGDKDRRDPIEEASPIRVPLIHKSSPLGRCGSTRTSRSASTWRAHEVEIRDFGNVVAASSEFAVFAQLF